MPLSDGTLPGFEAFQRWETGSARQTETFAINAPTIGAATLDGLNRFGEPYNFVEVNTPGWCDTLTSLPIALNGYFPESNVHLMFHYEAGGRGNAPDVGEDFLVLEFKSTDDVSPGKSFGQRYGLRIAQLRMPLSGFTWRSMNFHTW
jgi:hypothetical protein